MSTNDSEGQTWGGLHGYALIATLTAVLVLASCGDSGSSSATPAGPGSQAPAVAGFPATVQNCGHTLTFDKPPSRVVVSFQPTLETLISLGVGDRVIGRTKSLEHLGEAGFLPGQEKIVKSIPEVSDTTRPPSKEELFALQPDFVFGMSYADFDAAKGLATVEELNNAGIPVFIPRNWCDPASVEKFDVESTFDDIRNLDVFADGGEYDEVSVEEVAARNAQVYMIIDYAPQTPADRIKVIEEVASQSDGVKDKRYVVVPSVGIHPGVRVVATIETLAEALHPDAFK